MLSGYIDLSMNTLMILYYSDIHISYIIYFIKDILYLIIFRVSLFPNL